MINKLLKSGKRSYFLLPILVAVAMIITYALSFVLAVNNLAISGILAIIFCVLPLLSFSVLFINDGKTNRENILYFILGIIAAVIVLVIGMLLVLSIAYSGLGIDSYDKYGRN